jgi:regulator-associated protein of mTOR
LTAWRASDIANPLIRDSKLLCLWQQSQGSLYTAGLSHLIKLWDAEDEVCFQEIAIPQSTQVSSLSVDNLAGNILMTGFNDGSCTLYDIRLPESKK